MRISDWSSDVCSSDLHTYSHYRGKTYPRRPHRGARFFKSRYLSLSASRVSRRILNHICDDAGQKHGFWPYDDEPESQLAITPDSGGYQIYLRSEEHSVGKGCVSRCRFRWSWYH